MIKQVVWVTLIVSLLLGVGVGAWRAWTKLPYGVLSWVHGAYLAEFKLSWPYVKQDEMTQTFFYPNGRTQEKRSLDILNHPNATRAKTLFFSTLHEGLFWGLWTALSSFLSCSLLWIWRGRKNKQRKLLSGTRVVPQKTLRKLVKGAGKTSCLSLGKMALPQDLERKHMLICGTTGSGKTNCLHELLPQMRALGHRAIVVDLTGDFVSKYYRHGQDILMNPFDARSWGWNPWRECEQEYHYDDLAAALIPPSGHDPFWYTAARTLFSVALKKLKSQQDIKELMDYLTALPMSQMQRFFQDSKAAALVSKEGDQMATSIRATLAAATKVLEYLVPHDRTFSIRDWVRQEGPGGEWVFLTSRPDQRETLKPLLAAWLGVSISALLSLPTNPKRRLWFIMDELPALQEVASLPLALAEARKYGGCFVLGVQDFNQLDKIYGAPMTNSFMGLLNTKIVFSSPDDKTARRLSAVFGEEESSEIVEGLSYGAHHMRDGVNLSDQRRTRPVVSVTDITTLKDLEAFIKLPGHFPPTKVTFAYHKRRDISWDFVERKS
jgi:type IV conjugative transfer system coupling protein TraD